MHADAVVGNGVCTFQSRLEVVGVQHGILGDLAQPLGAVHGDVGVGAHEHAEVTVEGLDPADGLLRGDKAEQRRFVPFGFLEDPDEGRGQEVGQFGRNPHRARTGSAAAVRGGEGLVQVEVHHVEAQVPGPDDAQQGVQVGPVAVDQPAAFVDQV